MGSGGLGLTIALGMDASQAEAAADAFASQVSGGMAPQIAGAFKGEVAPAMGKVEDHILNAHHSAHLLAEEMGIKLPRVVTGAIAEMLPQLSTLGGALLAVFAVEKVFDFAEEGADKLREFFAKADEEAEMFDKAASEAFKHAGSAAEEMLTHFKTSIAGTFNIKEIDSRMKKLIEYHNAFKMLNEKAGGDARDLAMINVQALNTIVEAEKEGMRSIGDVDKKISELGALQFEAHQHMAEVKENEHKEDEAAARKAEEAQRKELERLHKVQEAEGKLASDRIRWAQDREKYFKADIVSGPSQTESQYILATLQSLSIAEHQQFLSRANDVKALVNLKVLDTTITKNMSNAMKEHFMVLQAGRQIQEEFAAAAKADAQAVQDDMLGSVEQLTEGFVALVGGQKAAAVFKAGYEIAEGIADLASGTWPPNPAAIIAAGLHFEAAAQYALMGGGGGGGRHGSRGVSRTSVSDAGGGSPSGVERGGGGPSGGSSSGSGQTIVQIQGNLNTNGQQQLAAWIGMGSSVGLYKLNASGSSGIAASRY